MVPDCLCNSFFVSLTSMSQTFKGSDSVLFLFCEDNGNIVWGAACNYFSLLRAKEQRRVDLNTPPWFWHSAETLVRDEMVMSRRVLLWSHATWRISFCLSSSRLISAQHWTKMRNSNMLQAILETKQRWIVIQYLNKPPFFDTSFYVMLHTRNMENIPNMERHSEQVWLRAH